MRLPQVGRASLFSLALAPIVGTSFVGFGDSQWSVLVGLVLMLLAAGIFIGMQAARSKRQYTAAEPKPAGDKLSNNLVALSSAAILAVYSAGYFRTNSAAQLFAEQSARMRVSASIAAGSMSSLSNTHPADSPFAIPQGISSGRSSGVDAARSSDATAAPKSVTSAATSAVTKDAAPVSSSRKTKSGSALSASATSGAGDQQAAAVPAAAPAPPPSPYKDGTFSGWGTCPHGNIQATVIIASGLIVAADVTRCETRYPCSMIDKLTDEVVYQQKADVDVVTGATESAYAFHIAVTEALTQALK